MSDWRSDPALGCGLMLFIAWAIVIVAAGFTLAFVWASLR